MREKLKKFLDKLCPLQVGEKVLLKRTLYFHQSGKEYKISKGERGIIIKILHNFYRVKFGEFLIDFNKICLDKFLRRDYGEDM